MKYKLVWGIERWKMMQHPAEEWYRIKQQIQYRFIDKKWHLKSPVREGFVFSSTYARNFSLPVLKEIVDATKNNVYQFKLLNVVINDIISNTQWNYDFKNNKQAQRQFIHNIDNFNYELGEIKYIYELSRLYHLPILAAYAIANNNRRLIRICINQLNEWSIQNPFLDTIAWKSGNEVGIRVINIILFRNLLELRPEYIDKEFDYQLNNLIELHYRFLISHLSLYSSKGNHYIGEIAGIIAICSTYSFKDSEKVLHVYWDELQNEIQRLIYPDGFNKEQATRYQASYINLFLTSIRFADSQDLRLKDASRSRIQAMCDFLENLKIDTTEFFHVGDNDNAELIYPYADQDYNVYESMLNDAVIMLDKKKEIDYHFDLRNYLLWGDEGLKKYQEATYRTENNVSCKFHKHSGYFIIKDEKIQCLIDVGKIGLLPGMSHGHSDILGIILYVDKKPILVDCGSYQYNVHYKKMRDYFHGVYAHNTISVNNQNQAIIGAGMFWLSNPKTTITDVQITNPPTIEASHNGYCRNGKQIIHTRRVEYRKQDNAIVISDRLISKNKDTEHFSFYLHFHPSVNVELDKERLIVDKACTITNPLFINGRLEKGNEELPLGWYSAGYDSIEATNTFILEMNFKHTIELYTIITF